MPQHRSPSTEHHSTEITDRSAHKLLELLLYNLHQNVGNSIDTLIKSGSELDSTMRLQLANLKEAFSSMEMLINDALKNKTKLSDGNLIGVDPDVVERIQVEKVLRTLATTTSAQDLEEFFKYCVKTLAQFYDCQYAFVGLLTDNKEEVITQAVWSPEGYVENFTYKLKGTPCAEIINLEKELIPTNASTLYADDELLVSMQIDSYFGAPILTKEDGVIGLVSVMDTRPMELNEWTAPVLGVFASRLAIEIQRKLAEQDLLALNETLEKRIKERTRDLEFSNQELNAFCYSVSHDLRAPVRTINSFVDILFEDFGELMPIESQDFLRRIKRSGKKLDQLIDDLLQLSRVSRLSMSREFVDISELVKEEVQALNDAHKDKYIDVEITPGMVAWGDEGLIRILYQNMLNNAWKYSATSPEPMIKAGVTDNEKGKIFYVQDNGIGFDMRYAHKLFTPFQRLHSEDEFEGNGIGLATIKRIVNRHGGDVWPESAPGEGATFYFTL